MPPMPRCATCGTTEQLLRCASCKTAYYCSPAHQHVDWPLHKQECRTLAKQKNIMRMQQLQQAIDAATMSTSGGGGGGTGGGNNLVTNTSAPAASVANDANLRYQLRQQEQQQQHTHVGNKTNPTAMPSSRQPMDGGGASNCNGFGSGDRAGDGGNGGGSDGSSETSAGAFTTTLPHLSVILGTNENEILHSQAEMVLQNSNTDYYGSFDANSTTMEQMQLLSNGDGGGVGGGSGDDGGDLEGAINSNSNSNSMSQLSNAVNDNCDMLLMQPMQFDADQQQHQSQQPQQQTQHHNQQLTQQQQQQLLQQQQQTLLHQPTMMLPPAQPLLQHYHHHHHQQQQKHQQQSHQQHQQQTTNHQQSSYEQQQQPQHQFTLSNHNQNQIEKSSSYQIGHSDENAIGNVNERRYEELCRNIINDMNQYGLSVVDDFLGTEKGLQILNEVHRMYAAGVFKDGQLVNNMLPEEDLRTIRGDKITWVKGVEPGCANVGYLINQIDAVICRANTMRNNGKLGNYNIKERTKAMVACYPGSGSHYIMHVDNPNKDGRVITAIYYLNVNWDTKNSGGVLRIFPEHGNTVADIEPKFDRLIFFWSDKRNPHEVQPAHRTRYAITVWYFDANEREAALNRCKYENTDKTATNNSSTLTTMAAAKRQAANAALSKANHLTAAMTTTTTSPATYGSATTNANTMAANADNSVNNKKMNLNNKIANTNMVVSGVANNTTTQATNQICT